MAEASGKKGKVGKQKAQKMSLGSFLTNDDLGSWADDVAGLPTAPAAAASDVYADREPSRPLNHRESFGGGDRGYSRDRDRDNYSGGGGGARDGYARMSRDYGGDRGDRGGRESAMERRGLPVPSRPPYIAHLGNLAYDLRESDVNNFFRDLRIVSVRLVRGSDDRPKGFGYVEFSDAESLEAALRMANESLAGRSVRIDVAEPPKEGHRGGGESEEKFSGDWRQRADAPRFASPTRSDSGNSMGDWRGGVRENGSRYSSGPERRSGYGFGGDRDRERGYGGDRYGGDRYGRDGGRDSPSASEWGNKRLSYQTDGGAQRRKLELLPRTVEAPRATSPADGELRSPTSTAGSEKSTEPAKKKADPFGGAKPRDEAEIQRKIEERRKEREEEKRRQEEAEKEKKRQEEEERQKREEEERLERLKREEEAAAVAKQKREEEEAAAAKARLEEEAAAEKKRQEAEQQKLERERKEAELKGSWRRSAPVGAASAAGVERSDSRGERGGGRGGRGRGHERQDGGSAWKDGSGRGRGFSGPGGRGRGVDRGPPRDPPSMPVAKDERADIKTKNAFEMLGEEVDE
ncbi:hypothetical protein BJ742DRAFT_782672 [Cladochytrium replicatum]|nr:hypothetical protein BJ742DRAFT_782672 [Cladochytrium replicatum]